MVWYLDAVFLICAWWQQLIASYQWWMKYFIHWVYFRRTWYRRVAHHFQVPRWYRSFTNLQKSRKFWWYWGDREKFGFWVIEWTESEDCLELFSFYSSLLKLRSCLCKFHGLDLQYRIFPNPNYELSWNFIYSVLWEVTSSCRAI